jgi:hypothetical protein
MIRRVLLVAAAAVALILAPSVAMAAYNAPGFGSSVSDSTPAIGHPVTVTINGGAANAGQMIKLVITSDAGTTMSFSKRANANGVVKFTFKLSAAGTYKVEAFNAAGALVSDQVLTVASQAASAVPSSKQLSSTGFDGMPLAVGGGVLVLVGAGAVVVARRRRSAQVPA